MTHPTTDLHGRLEKATPGNSSLMQYAGYAAQLAAGLIIGILLGMWIDKKLNIGFPIFIWSLPLVILIGMLVRVVKDTTTKK
jgi:F0F1-type ATP synthase assembly protein I